MAQRTDERLPVPHQGVEHVGLRHDRPETGDPRAVLVLAHGSGAALDSAFLEGVAPTIADRAGIHVLRFNYAYAELMLRSGKPRPPERKPALEAVHAAVLEYARGIDPELPLLAGGKSLGGRIASMMVAEGRAAEVRGLVFLGYPLHPPGKPERRRSDHFPAIGVPSLFLQGTRDALCDLELLEEEWPKLSAGPATLHVVEGADHGFEVLRRSGRTRAEVDAELAEAIRAWADDVVGAGQAAG